MKTFFATSGEGKEIKEVLKSEYDLISKGFSYSDLESMPYPTFKYFTYLSGKENKEEAERMAKMGRKV